MKIPKILNCALGCLTAVAFGATFMGCANPQVKQMQRQLAKKDQELFVKRIEIQNLKAQNQILLSKTKDSKAVNSAQFPVPFAPSAALAEFGAPAQSDGQTGNRAAIAQQAANIQAANNMEKSTEKIKDEKEPAEINGVIDRAEESSEYLLYSKVAESFKKENPQELRRSSELFLKSFPESAFADGALYLCAKSESELGHYQEALDILAKMSERYPTGSKGSAGLLLQAQIRRKLGNENLSRALYQKVVDEYPGSPEAIVARADIRGSVRVARGGRR